MNEKETTHGLTCPKCGGMVAIPEGQLIVKCPYCELRSYVRGERGLRRYQVPQRVQRQNAIQALNKFLTGSWAIARDAAQKAQLSEAFLVYLPFWTVWARVAGWAFGQKKVGSGDSSRYEPREVRVVQEMAWNGAACDVGEFGVTQVPPVDSDLQPFNPDSLHNSGLVFEPVGSFSQARESAEHTFQQQVQRRAGLDRLAQLFIRHLRQRFALVYHPLWVIRYLYRQRAFQVVVDGYTGRVLYGKAPGNTLYRAAALVGGAAAGAFLMVDVPSIILYLAGSSSDSDGIFWFALGSFVIGAGLMYAGYRAFRYGEQYELRSGSGAKTSTPKLPGIETLGDTNFSQMLTQVKDVEEWINRLT